MVIQLLPPTPPYADVTKGDLVIRSCDGVNFHVHTCIMENMSPVFADMFSLPPVHGEGEKPRVDVTEPADTWNNILGFSYHVVRDDSESSISLTDIQALLEAAQKYRMAAVTRWMRDALLQSGYAESQPLRTYAVACAYGLSDVALVAARGWLEHSVESDELKSMDVGHAKELELISALQYKRLLNFRERCATAAVQAVSVGRNPVPSWVTSHGEWLSARQSGCTESWNCEENALVIRNKTKTRVVLRLRSGWLEYFQGLAAQLKTTPSPSAARSSKLLGPVIASAACKECRLKILERTTRFTDLVAARIEQAIYQVSLKL
ncbi:hypothetical protein BV20DRAFT_1039123 [Pilatotrama ljubarskyi]|nr:hypothetical protein BV20DRAFT_1039123 [Pilatotrama ljubarskyi]